MSPGANAVMHIIEILGIFVCIKAVWPKGIIYGEQEDWEKAYRKKHRHSSRSSSSKQPHRYESSRSERIEGVRRHDKEDQYSDDRYYNERAISYYDERPVYSRKASSRY